MNFDLIDDIHQQQASVESRYENVSSDAVKVLEHNFITSAEFVECQRNEFHVDPSVALTSSSSDPKLFNALSPDTSLSSLGSVAKAQNANVISSLPIQLAPQQIATLQQQHMLQVGIGTTYFIEQKNYSGTYIIYIYNIILTTNTCTLISFF